MTAWEARPGALDEPTIVGFLRSISPRYLPGHPTIPVLLYQDAADEFAPMGPSVDTMKTWCSRGTRVEIHIDPGGEHILYEQQGLPVGLGYLADRFAGKPAPSTCPPSPPSARPPALRALLLLRGTLRANRDGWVTLRVRNPNGFAVKLTTVSLLTSGRSLGRRALAVVIGAGRSRVIRLRLRPLNGRRRIRAVVSLVERAPGGRTALTRARRQLLA